MWKIGKTCSYLLKEGIIMWRRNLPGGISMQLADRPMMIEWEGEKNGLSCPFSTFLSFPICTFNVFEGTVMRGFHWYVEEHNAQTLKLQKEAWHLSGDREVGGKEAKKKKRK